MPLSLHPAYSCATRIGPIGASARVQSAIGDRVTVNFEKCRKARDQRQAGNLELAQPTDPDSDRSAGQR